MADQYPMKKYTKELCDAVKAYDYPAVTYDFQNGKEVCHKNIRQVEENIKTQLFSPNPEEVKDGLSNVLYWGYASLRREGNGPCDGYIPMTGRQKDRIPKFQKVCDSDLNRFIQTIRDLHSLKLSDIRKISLPQFSGVSFISKAVMFLCPSRYPVLDLNIARFTHSEGFPPLQYLSFNRKDPSKATAIPLNLSTRNGQATGELTSQGKRNEQCYENWASWCIGIADLVNSETSQCLRAVDVERGIFQLVGSEKDDIPIWQREENHAIARQLLNCPEGWTHEKVIDHARQLETKN